MNAVLRPETTAPTLAMRAVFERQRAAFASDMWPSYAVRLERLNRLYAMTERIAPEIVSALSSDFGQRSPHVTRLADIMMVLAAIKHARRKLRQWMKTRRAPVALAFLPAHNRVMPQPLGVVGIVAPWNYAYQLALGPAIAAIAAGNRVMIKPAEMTPRLSQLLQRAIAETFAPEEICVITGDAEVAKAFVTLPFDHLLFTGSTEVGRQVALAAAANLTPVTLELGGKSPAILHSDCNLPRAAASLLVGKMLNAGQTCLAPDYVAVPRAMRDQFVAAMHESALRLYPNPQHNPDCTSIINERHHQRLQELLDDARARGAKIVTLARDAAVPDAAVLGAPRIMAPALVLDVNDQMRIMQQEIFGPLLPVLVYDTLDEVIAYVNRHERPLALYWYGRNAAAQKRILSETISGGVTINDCIWHFGQEELPFGGVGASGMGVYHGEAGFRTFSKHKPVFHQSALSGIPLLYPPYGRMFEVMAKVLKFIS